MLSVGRERQRRENRADRGSREACANGETNCGEKHAEKLRRDKDDVQISEEAKTVNTEVDETDGHSEFGGKIKTVSRAFD